MGYKRAEEILPKEIIELIQKYVDGESIYIPRKKDNRQEWGKTTQIKQRLIHRNTEIFKDYTNGYLLCIIKFRSGQRQQEEL